MGPQLLRCGNITAGGGLSGSQISLQWGRSFYAAEILHPTPEVFEVATLQWGRSFYAAEIAFLRPDAVLAAELQWGRSFYAAEITSGSPSQSKATCFNGAAAFTLRKSREAVVIDVNH